ncbi:response regulator [Magnetococcales bacterium HHB-1]
MEHPNKILIVEDDEETATLVCEYLIDHGYQAYAVNSGEQMWLFLKKHDWVDLIIMDIMLPGEDGLALCRKLNVLPDLSDIPIIMLTAQGDEMDRILGLEMGADDYLTKPFSPRELLARIKNVLRRVRALARTLPEKKEIQEIHFAGWRLHLNAQKLTSPEQVSVALTRGEFALMMVFLRNPNQILDRDRLLELYQQREAKVFDRSIDAQVSRLRKRLGETPKSAKILKTVWGKGYMLTTEVEEK